MSGHSSRNSLFIDAVVAVIAVCAGAGAFDFLLTAASSFVAWHTGAMEGLSILDSLSIHLFVYLALGACVCGFVVGAFARRSVPALSIAIGATAALAYMFWWSVYHLSIGQPPVTPHLPPVVASLAVPLGCWISRRSGLNSTLSEWLGKPWTWRLGMIEVVILAAAVVGAAAIAGPMGASPTWRITAGRITVIFLLVMLKLQKRL